MNEIKITKAETKIERALDWLVEAYPCFTSVRAQWQVREDAVITKTMATNGKTLFWNRSFVDWMTNEETRWVVLHEAGHVFLGHHFRLLGEEQESRNIALDLALNYLIQSSCPDRIRKMGCFPGLGKFADMPLNEEAEVYMRLLKQDQPPQQDSQDDEDEQEGEDADDQGEGGSSEEQSDEDGDQDGQDGAESDQGDEGGEEEGDEGQSGSEGQGEGKGKPQTFDPDSAEQGDMGEVLEVAEEEAEQAEQEWTEIVSEGILAAEIAGKMPGWAKEMQKKLAGKARVRWFHILRNHMQELSDNGQTYDKVNRKSAWRRDIILPTSQERNCGKGVILVDTSGSMSANMMNSAIDRISEIVREFAGVEVTLLQCDTRLVGRERTFTAADFPIRVPVEWFGRGGTDMDPALREISYKKAAKEWAWCVIISDMCWNVSTAVNPGIPCFWVNTRKGGWYQKPRHGVQLEAAE